MFKSLLDGIKSFIGGTGPSGDEVRDRARVLCRYPVDCSTTLEDVPFRAQVVDVSRSGMRLEGVGNVAKGDKFFVAYVQIAGAEPITKDVEPVEVEVMWCRKRPHDGEHLAGVRYADPEQVSRSWVHYVLDEVGLSVDKTGAQRRKHIRLATALRAELRDQATGEHIAEGKVANLSVGGTLVQTEQPVTEGHSVLVLVSPYNNFPIFSVPAKVMSVRYDPDEGQTFVSLQFFNVNARQLKTLKRFMFNLLKGRSIG
ncbi:PilZ domain-containing protein [bacterium]|nr:PilZ domain-containing protein [bacterium]